MKMSSGLPSRSLQCDWQNGCSVICVKKKRVDPKPGGGSWDPLGSRPLKASRLEIRLKNDGALL